MLIFLKKYYKYLVIVLAMLKSFLRFWLIGLYVLSFVSLFFLILCFCFYWFCPIFFLLHWICILHCFFLSIFLFGMFFGLISDTIHVWSLLLVVFGIKLLFFRWCSFVWFLCHKLCLLWWVRCYIFLSFLLLILRILCRVWVLLRLVSIESFFILFRLQYGFLWNILHCTILFLGNICRCSHCWIHFRPKRLVLV